MTDRPNMIDAEGQVVPMDDATFAQWEIDQAAAQVPPVPNSISRRQFAIQLAVDGDITWDEASAFAGGNTLPQALASAVAQIPIDEDPNARNKAQVTLLSCGSVDRDNPLTEILGEIINRAPAQLDDIWRAASLIQ